MLPLLSTLELVVLPPMHLHAVLMLCRRMTPPLDEEVENNDSRSIEANARKILENKGCPPCYHTYLEIPLRDPPEKYRAVIVYWKSFPGTGDVVLHAQFSDWKRFREYQKTVRRYYRHGNLSDFVNQVRERR